MNEGNKPSVLIVDDARENIDVLVNILSADYLVKVAINGPGALKAAFSPNPPDLILLDVMMPGMDGYQTCRLLKADQRTRNIPVIFITARSKAEDETYGFSLGAVDYIRRPFDAAIVKARLRTHLRLKSMTDALESMAWIDALTGIPNRRCFDETLEREWRRSQRNRTPLSLIMLDVDHFKNYNDLYGHVAGDDCLKRVAQKLSAALRRPADFVARYGGEEFVLLAPETDAKGANTLAEYMRSQLEALQIPHESSEASKWVTVSIGHASVVPGETGVFTALLEEADSMLYRAKRTGRNRIYGIQDPDTRKQPTHLSGKLCRETEKD